MELDLKPVEYFGKKLTVSEEVQWLAVDADGKLCGYKVEPQTAQQAWSDGTWSGADYICEVDLQDVYWRDTKVRA